MAADAGTSANPHGHISSQSQLLIDSVYCFNVITQEVVCSHLIDVLGNANACEPASASGARSNVLEKCQMNESELASQVDDCAAVNGLGAKTSVRVPGVSDVLDVSAAGGKPIDLIEGGTRDERKEISQRFAPVRDQNVRNGRPRIVSEKRERHRAAVRLQASARRRHARNQQIRRSLAVAKVHKGVHQPVEPSLLCMC